MKKFLIKITAFGGFFLLLLFSYIFLSLQYFRCRGMYLSEYSNKIERLSTIQGQKIVILGGSNTAFGIDSKKIQDALLLPVANHGLSMHCGIQLSINDAKQYVNKGDIVLLIPEYENFYQFAYGKYGELNILFALYPSIIKRCEKGHIKALFDGKKRALELLTSMSKAALFDSSSGYAYNSSNFNALGDEYRHWSAPLPESLLANGLLKDLDKEYVEKFTEEVRKLRERGVVVYLMPPSVYTKYWEAESPRIAELLALLRHYGEEYVIPPDSMVFARDEMFDSYYHLNRKGTDRRTRMIVEYLEKASR